VPAIRVLVVDDSSTQRAMLIHLLQQDPDIDVAGWAATGVEALRAVERLQPDVITLDDRMPGMSGLDTARRVMHEWPTPIVMVSAAAAQVTDAAIAAGVVAVHDKRALAGTDPSAPNALIRAIKSMASVRVVRQRREASTSLSNSGAPILPTSAQLRTGTPEIVAIGASTGGPQVVREILSRLPASFPLPIVVVQHTTAGYSKNLVDWLDASSPLRVKVAEDGEPLGKSAVYVAPTQQHLVVRGRHLALLDAAPVSLHRPSVTVLFKSVAAAYGARGIGVLLTGMGDDGAAGLADMRCTGATTIAQDEQTSVVFGMPAEAIRLGAVEHVLPPTRIPGLLMSLTTRVEAA
jgi:two-component system chemotaxis response regulator CheB